MAGYQAWKALGRQVNKGEHGIQILAPVLRRTDPAQSNDELEPAPGPSGTTGRHITGFRIAHVFDTAQTTGEPPPTQPQARLPSGEAPPGLWDALADLIAADGYRLQRGPCGGANGITDPLRRVVRVRADIDDAQAVKTLAHELGHVRLHAATLPPGEDPASLLAREGPAALIHALTAASRPLIDHVLDRRLTLRQDRLQWVEGRLAALVDVAPIVALYPPKARSQQVARLATRLDLLEESVRSAVVTAARNRPRNTANPRRASAR